VEAELIVHIIDDDEPVRHAIVFALSAIGLGAVAYADVEDFLQRGRDAKGVIVSDVRMQGTNGLDLIRILRTDGVTTPIILMTGHLDLSLRARANSAGADVVLSKPFVLNKLVAEIARAAAVVNRFAEYAF